MNTDTPRLAIVLPVLVTASAASMMSTDLYTPSLPSLPGYFSTSERLVQLTITLNVVAFAIAQLIHGPLSDRFGRRRIMLLGLVGFILASLACTLAESIAQLIAARILQGFMAAVEAVVGLAVVRDLFHGADRIRAYAIWGVAVAAAPGVAPIIGGYVHVALGWRANFALVTLIGVMATYLVWRYLAESTTPDHGALHPRRLMNDYLSLLRSAEFIRYAVILGASLGAIFAFITEAPFLLIDRYGVATQHFGYYHCSMVAGYMVGSFVTDRYARRIDHEYLLGIGAVCAAGGSLCLLVLLHAPFENELVLTAVMTLIALGLGPIFAIAPAQALEIVPTGAGTAAAMIGAFEMGFGGIASAAVTIQHDGTVRPLVATVLALCLIAMVVWRTVGVQPAASEILP